MLPENFVYAGIGINIIALFSYFIDTLKGKIKPNRISFILWSLAPFIIFFAQIKQGVGASAIMTFSTAILPLFILLASFINKKAYWKLTRFDFTCGAFSLVGLLLWQITQVGNVAIICSILADVLATLPTLVKAYNFPKTEASWQWLAISLNGFFTLLIIKTWDFATVAYPLYFFLSCFAIFVVVKFRFKKLFIKLRTQYI